MALQDTFCAHNLQRGILLPFLLLLSLSTVIIPTSSRIVNVTVDDQLGDPTTGLFPDYSPNDGTWHIGSRSEDCASCFINSSVLDLTQIYQQTWHDATYRPPGTPATITIRFNGSAVYVYNILANTLPQTNTFTNISFSIDGEDVGIFTRSPELGTTSILYNQLVYHNAAPLNDGPHTLTMTAGNESLILFDYLVYTTQSNDTTPSSSASSSTTSTSGTTQPARSSHSSSPGTRPPVGGIVGGVLGGIALLGVGVGAFFLSRRSKHSRATTTSIKGVNHGENGGGSIECEDGVRLGLGGRHGASLSGLSLPLSPTMRPSLLEPPSLDGATARSLLLASDVSGADTRPSLVNVDVVADAQASAAGGGSTSTSKRREELTRRLETLQRSRSILSSQSPSAHRSRSDFSSESGAEAAIRELEGEIAQLRGAVLTTLNERLADRGDDLLPAYAE